MEIYKRFTIESAHWLPNVPDGHKCGRLHGHSINIIISISGMVSKDTGWVADFSDIKAAFKPLYAQLDHNCLNHIEGLENPTSENLCFWIWMMLKERLPSLSKVEVCETCNSGCIYLGPDKKNVNL
ncbi:MAG: 6-carboxytetrahydropterin synthase QueD [Alcanivoracaceae bacterium]|nr:6-carboxytetrahydropterin synthase QueD [Alcanivoracaceae bacterium]